MIESSLYLRELQQRASQNGMTWSTLFNETNGKIGDEESIFIQTNARYFV